MGYLRLLWRLARFLTIQLPIIAIMAVAVLAILENLNLLSFDGLKLIGFAAVASILAGMLCLIPFRRSPDSHGTARFATSAEIRKAGLRKKGLIIGKLGREFLRLDSDSEECDGGDDRGRGTAERKKPAKPVKKMALVRWANWTTARC